MGMRTDYILPDRTRTKSVKRYIKEWRKLTKNVPKIFGKGWECIAYDPGVLIARKHETLNLSVEMIQSLNALYEKATRA